MSGYKSLDEIEVVLRSGAGIAVICEGEDHREDEFVFNTWFSSMARRVTFHAQDGWKRVQEAVTELRRRNAPVPIFGLMDRDFTPDEDITRQMDPSFEGFLYRLPRYDIESYLLDPDGWFEVLHRDLFRREGKAPQGWDSIAGVAQRIHELFLQALPIAAHNGAIQSLRAKHEGTPGYVERRYFRAIEAIKRVRPEDELAVWARSFGAEQEAREVYQGQLRLLEARTEHTDDLRAHVSGKVVFRALGELIPHAPGRKRLDRMSLADRYLDRRPHPPPEVVSLVERILTRGERERAH